MAIYFRKVLIAGLIIALLPGLWNIFLAVILTMKTLPLEGTFLDALWTKFGNFGPVESMIANIAFFVVAIWQGASIAHIQAPWTAFSLSLGAGFLAASLHIGMHLGMGVYQSGDMKIGLSIMAGVLIGVFYRLHIRPMMK